MRAISGAHTSKATFSSRLLARARGIGVRQVRLACGLVMFAYIFSHFFNHALGNISFAAMDWWLKYHILWWRFPVVNYTLYAAATTHFASFWFRLWPMSGGASIHGA